MRIIFEQFLLNLIDKTQWRFRAKRKEHFCGVFLNTANDRNTAKDDKGPQIDVLNTAKCDKRP